MKMIRKNIWKQDKDQFLVNFKGLTGQDNIKTGLAKTGIHT